MSDNHSKDQMAGYTEAVKSGLYAKRSGMVGKYDNVRLYWEDEVSRGHMQTPLQRLIERCMEGMRRLRIMDLGCGSADGYELLAGVRQRDPDLRMTEVDLLTPEVLGCYTGTDLNKELLAQAASIYGDNPKMHFREADFTQGLPLEKGEEPYDLYFCSYGTCSHHNDDETMVRLLCDIAENTREYSVVVCDWLGRYSYEWQSLWTNDFDELRNMDYVVSYIYDEEERERKRDELQHLTLRVMSRQEADTIIAEAGDRSGIAIRPITFFDRSIFTGRHLDTGEYNPHAKPLRKAVNSLHESNQRTDFSDLLFDYVPKPGFDFLNAHFEYLQMAWNSLLEYVALLLEVYDENEKAFTGSVPEIPASYPESVRVMMDRMRHVVEGVGWLKLGLPRENIIEPQLGYALRHLVTNLQQGQGCGHGLVAILDVDKTGK